MWMGKTVAMRKMAQRIRIDSSSTDTADPQDAVGRRPAILAHIRGDASRPASAQSHLRHGTSGRCCSM